MLCWVAMTLMKQVFQWGRQWLNCVWNTFPFLQASYAKSKDRGADLWELLRAKQVEASNDKDIGAKKFRMRLLTPKMFYQRGLTQSQRRFQEGTVVLSSVQAWGCMFPFCWWGCISFSKLHKKAQTIAVGYWRCGKNYPKLPHVRLCPCEAVPEEDSDRQDPKRQRDLAGDCRNWLWHTVTLIVSEDYSIHMYSSILLGTGPVPYHEGVIWCLGIL